jgi:alpha-ribazole phosphatase
MKSYIHFIRHGLTEGNLRKWYYGWSDLPLAEEGVSALQNLRTQGVYPSLGDADCYTSGMLRTEQTLETIYGDIPHQTLPLMKEMNFGTWECKTFEELKSEPLFDTWMNDKDGTMVFPEGDSVITFYARIREGLSQLRGLHRMKELSHRHSGKDAVSLLVCHGGVIAASMENMFPHQRENFWQWIPEPGRGYTVYFQESEPVSYEVI